METRYFITMLILAILLIGCSEDAITGEVVDAQQQLEQAYQEQKATLESKIDSIETTSAEWQAKWKTATTTINDLKAMVADKEKLLGQQLQVLHEMDDERADAVADAEGCDERIEELETQVAVLQRWIAVCEDEMGIELG